MARFKSANFVGPVPNETPGGMFGYLGVVLHVEDGSESGTKSWFFDPRSKSSAHFGNPKVGRAEQFVDTRDKAWAQGAGNPLWISIENEGHGEALNENQLNNLAAILAEAHQIHGIPLMITDSINVPGIGWHGMGGMAWGGHPNCPGNAIRAQRGEAIHRANIILQGGTSPAPSVAPRVVNVMVLGPDRYATIGPDGGVFNTNTPFYGSLGGRPLSAPIVGGAYRPDGTGYWLVGADGGVFSFGEARFLGSTGGFHLNAPIVALKSAPDGQGYWLVGADGGIYTFGNARFFGSLGGHPLNKPIVDMAVTSNGEGYWLIASDGGVFTFGNARFFGSTGDKTLNAPIKRILPTSSGNGYWLVAEDGGIYSFGDAGFGGSYPQIGGQPNWNSLRIVGVAPNGRGYYTLIRQDNGAFSFPR